MESYPIIGSDFKERWFLRNTPQEDLIYSENMKKEGFVLIKNNHSSGEIVQWREQKNCIEINGKWFLKVDVIIEAFGEKEWAVSIKNELKLKQGDGIQGLHKIMKDAESRKKYIALRDDIAQMAAEKLSVDQRQLGLI